MLIKYNDENLLISTSDNGSVMNLQNEKLSELPKEIRLRIATKKESTLFARISNFFMELLRE